MKQMILTRSMLTGLMAAGLGAGLMGLTAGCTSPCCGCKGNKEATHMRNEGFYKDGQFDAAKAKQAYYDLMEKFNVPVYAELKRPDGPFWAVDFGKGDFTAFGMGGVFW